MSANTIKFDLNLAGLWAKYFRSLQQLFDTTNFLRSGCSSLREEDLRDLGTFMVFNLAKIEERPFETLRAQSDRWLLSGFFRDAMEHTGLFLDDCLNTCALIEVAARKKASGAEITELFSTRPRRHHRLHLPQKLEKLERNYGVASPLADHIISMNRLRACVVHRVGLVTDLDVDESRQLVVKCRTTRVTARGEETGKEVLLDRPGIQLTEQSVIELQFTDHELKFGLGQHVRLSPTEIHACLATFFQFGHSVAQLIEAFARRSGLAVNNGTTR